jgi:hypothetical protein
MRTLAGLIGVLFAGVLSQALATEPQTQSQAQSEAQSQSQAAATPTPDGHQSATATDGQQSAAAPAAQQNAAPSPTPASASIKPPVTVVGTKPEDLSNAEKELIARGYKVEMRNGEKYFCRREQQIGSRFETKICDTAQSIQARRAESQEAVRTIQNDRPLINH